MSTVISVEILSKKYQIGLREKKHQTFREAVMETVASPLKRFRELSGNGHADSEFWALRDVSFEVREGEVLGIIGRNGAGKSTLLKILSRITEPTSGRAVIRGRVASLLEVGTGFHNELSGRENVYLNGAILGMTKSEIDRKFDEIVDFSGVEKFLDTAIKHYSSGMKVRLAFAVAANLDPEILIIDEVLAVGDQEFQNKCMGKMQDVAVGGRTVLFVSHNMPAVELLCSRAIQLRDGRLVQSGDVAEVVANYLSRGGETGADGELRFVSKVFSSVTMHDEEGHPTSSVPCGGSLGIEFRLRPGMQLDDPAIRLTIDTSTNLRVATCNSRFQFGRLSQLTDLATMRCELRELRLAPGDYHFSLTVLSGSKDVEHIESALQLTVVPRDIYGTGRLTGSQKGYYLPNAVWEFGDASRPNPQPLLAQYRGDD